LEEGDIVLGDRTFKIILTPGHSPVLSAFTGRNKKPYSVAIVIFDQSVGRTDFPGGNGALLKKSIISFSKLIWN